MESARLRAGLARIYGWRRLVLALGFGASIGLLISVNFTTTAAAVVAFRQMLVAFVCLTMFGIFETWPARLPRWIPRWAVQVLASTLVIPFTVAIIYAINTAPGQPHFYRVPIRFNGFIAHTMSALVVVPWAAVAALFYQRDAAARNRELAFHLERSEFERKALDARLRMLQAQVEPHFLFNTLANVRELVDSGSPQASRVLENLIAYLRGAVPRLHEATAALADEVKLARAYLELMQMRMPDRLQFSFELEPAAMALRCPPTTILTPVENAIRHGIDPSEDGGRVDVSVRAEGDRCVIRVCDTGMGLSQDHAEGLGTGLATLRERLQLTFGDRAQLRLFDLQPRGTCTEVVFPADARPA